MAGGSMIGVLIALKRAGSPTVRIKQRRAKMRALDVPLRAPRMHRTERQRCSMFYLGIGRRRGPGLVEREGPILNMIVYIRVLRRIPAVLTHMARTVRMVVLQTAAQD